MTCFQHYLNDRNDCNYRKNNQYIKILEHKDCINDKFD